MARRVLLVDDDPTVLKSLAEALADIGLDVTTAESGEAALAKLAEFTPDVILHFHGYMGWRRHCQPPYDGIYFLTDADRLYTDPQRLAAYRAIQDRLIFETPAYTAAWTAGQLTDVTLEHQLAAKFGTLSAFYEINTASVAAFEQFRRGPQVLGAVVRALVRDTGIFG